MTLYVGGTPTVRVPCKTEAGVLANATALDVTVYRPDGTVLVTYAIGALTLESTGLYKLPVFTVDVAGWHNVKSVATGAPAGVGWSRFLVHGAPSAS